MRNMVIADKSIEDTDMYCCRECDFQSRYLTRLKSHISNRHFVGPAVPCKLCGFHSKNINSLCQHIFRNHNNIKAKTIEGTHSTATASSIQVEPPECPPPPPPTLSSGQTGLVMERHMIHRSPTDNGIPTNEKRITTTLSLRDAVCGNSLQTGLWGTEDYQQIRTVVG